SITGDLSPGGAVAIATADLSTGEVHVQLERSASLSDRLGQIEPSELLLPRSWEVSFPIDSTFPPATYRADWLFEAGHAREELRRHYEVHNLDGFGVPEDPALLGALGALVTYLGETQPRVSAALRPPRFIGS